MAGMHVVKHRNIWPYIIIQAYKQVCMCTYANVCSYNLHILRSSFEFLMSSPSPETQDPMLSHMLAGRGGFGEDGLLE